MRRWISILTLWAIVMTNDHARVCRLRSSQALTGFDPRGRWLLPRPPGLLLPDAARSPSSCVDPKLRFFGGIDSVRVSVLALRNAQIHDKAQCKSCRALSRKIPAIHSMRRIQD